MKITYLTSTVHADPAAVHARFNDTIQYLHSLEDSPFEFDVITCNFEGNEDTLSDRVWHVSDYRKHRQVMSFMREVRRHRDQTDIFHLNQTDMRLALPALLAAGSTIPMVVGPNISTYHRPGLAWTLPWSIRRLRIHLRVSQNYLNRLLYHKYSPLSSYFNAYIAFSEYFKRELERSGVNGEKITVMPSGVPSDIFYPDENAKENYIPVILYVGSPDKIYWKGFDIFVKALANLQTKGYEYRAVVVGEPPEEGATELLKSWNVNGAIEFTGWVERKQLGSYYRMADVCVNPSRYETEGMTAVEARACGTPVISSNLPPLESKSNITFQSGNADAMATALKEFLSDMDKYKTEALRTVSEFGMEPGIKQLEQIYADLLETDDT